MRVSRLELPALAVKSGWLALGVGVALCGCATQQTAQHYSHGHEHFSQAKYGHASPKVVADGQPVPKGGGQYLVGHPYTVAGHTYYPHEVTSYTAVGMASWYGAAFHGRRTANGEVYDMASITAAHPTMPLPSYARVTNLSNGYSVIVRVNDRGPYHGGRVMDVSSRTADVLGFKGEGTARIKVEYVGQAPMEGSDDSALLASLRTDGSPANLNGYSAPTMVASAEPGPVAVCGPLFVGPRRAAAGARTGADPHRRDRAGPRRRGRAAAGSGAGGHAARRRRSARDRRARRRCHRTAGPRSSASAAALRPGSRSMAPPSSPPRRRRRAPLPWRCCRRAGRSFKRARTGRSTSRVRPSSS